MGGWRTTEEAYGQECMHVHETSGQDCCDAKGRMMQNLAYIDTSIAARPWRVLTRVIQAVRHVKEISCSLADYLERREEPCVRSGRTLQQTA